MEGLLARLQAKIGRLQRPDLNELLTRLRHGTRSKQDQGLITPSAINVYGFYQYLYQSGATGVSGLAFRDGMSASAFYWCTYYAQAGANRVSYGCGGSAITPLATGLSAPIDIAFSPSSTGPFGDYLYVAEAGANRISRIGPTGTITPFATFTVDPRRMAFSPSSGSFTPNTLFVTLADGRIVKVNSAGTVSPCVSGLSGPEGLVFGPGGTAYKDVLFVAEAAANRISKVTSACTATPFVSSGLTSPVGLEISPGGAFGPVDTLYVTHGTSVSRVDGAGVVSPFASGFSSTQTLRFFSYYGEIFDRIGYASLYVSDFSAGTVSEIYANWPYVGLVSTGCNPCTAGQTLTMNAQIGNSSPLDLPTEIKGGFRLLDGNGLTVAPLLGDNHHFEIILPAGFSYDGPWLSFTVPALMPGTYCYILELLDPVASFYPYTSGSTCFDVLP